MCMKTPKVNQPTDKPPQYLRNPFLDGLAIGQGQGRNSLRIDRVQSTPAANGEAGKLVQLPEPLPPTGGSHGLFIPPTKVGSNNDRRRTQQV